MDSEAPRREYRAETLELLNIAIKALEDKKAEDITIMDIGAVSSLCDLFVVASGTSGRHCETLVDAVIQSVREIGQKPYGSEGKNTGWSLIDFGDIVVHVFDTDTREYYDLERLWLDAPRLEEDDIAVPAAS